MTLFRPLLSLLFAASLFGSAPAAEFVMPGPVAYGWSAELPFSPDAAITHEGTLRVASVSADGDRVRLDIRLTEIDRFGLVTPEAQEGGIEFQQWRAFEAIFSGVADREFLASSHYWIFADRDAGALAIADALTPDATLISLPAAPAKLGDIEITGGVLYAMVESETETRVAAINLSSPTEWKTSEPLPRPYNGMAIMKTNDRLHLVGGMDIERDRETRRFFRVPVEGDGSDLGAIQSFPQSVPRGMGVSNAAVTNNLVMVTGDSPLVDSSASPTSQTVLFSYDRVSKILSPWRQLHLPQVPATEGLVLLGDQTGNQFLALGGTSIATGEPNMIVAGYPKPMTDVVVIERSEAAFEESKAKRSKPVAYFEAAKSRAVSQDRFILLWLFENDLQRAELSFALNFEDDVRIMSEDLIFAEPETEEERAALIGRYGVASVPAVVLLDPNANRVGRFEGIPDQKDMFELLKPMWMPLP